MSRSDLPQSILGKQAVHGVLLVEIEHPQGVFRVHSGVNRIVAGGDVYEGVGTLMQLSNVSDASTGSGPGVWEMSLSRANEMFSGYVFDDSLRDRAVKLSVTISEDGKTWREPVNVKVGRISSVGVEDAGITAECATAALDLQRVTQPNVLWTDSQQREYVSANDVTFRNINGVLDVELSWP